MAQRDSSALFDPLEAQYSPSILLPLNLTVTVDLIRSERYKGSALKSHTGDVELFAESDKSKDEAIQDYSNSSGSLGNTLPASSHSVQIKEVK